MASCSTPTKGFLTRLLHNEAGNTLAIVAAAIFPLMAVIGSGVDMSRAYMAKSRLQQACDAAALAGRRAMTGASMTADDKAEAKKFFDFNFPQESFGTAKFTPSIASKEGETTTVTVSANTTIPTSVMQIFGYDGLAISTSCDSKFDIGNTDVMLVLDTTGSMKESISDGSGGTTTRMAALRQAVKDFYDVLGAGDNSTGRIRYGFVPYASTVNVGYLLPSEYLIGGTSGESWAYQTRRLKPNGYTTDTTNSNWAYVSGSRTNGRGTVGPMRDCPSIPNDTDRSPISTSTGSPVTDSNGVITTSTTYTRIINGVDYSEDGRCEGERKSKTQDYTSITYNSYTETRTEVTTQTPKYVWEYGQFEVDVSDYISGNAVANPVWKSGMNNNGVPSTTTWQGCIEERSTISSITSSSALSIPNDAYDLQIDTIPNSRETKWRPHWPEVMFSRSSSSNGQYLNTSSRIDGGWNACPSRARKLRSYDNRTTAPAGENSSFDDYINSLEAVGGTYHDIGMIWGARLLSPTGIFADENDRAPNGFSISRHIVFMTDGDMSAYDSAYGAWGYNLLDGREGPTSSSNSNLTSRHNRRLEMICNAIKGQGITIWVVAFAEGYSSQLISCATSANHAALATNAAELKAKFKQIAQNIGGLRLSN